MVRRWMGVAAALLIGAIPAQAEIVLDLLPRTLSGNALDVIEPGDEFYVFIRVSVTEDDNPTEDVRLMQFDFRATEAQIELVSFEWRLRAAGLFNEDLYERTTSLPDGVRATYTGEGREPGYILDIDEDFRIIARVQVIAHRSGTLSVTSTDLSDPENTDEGCWFVAGFDVPEAFTPHDGSVEGGELFITVEGSDGFNGNDNSSANTNSNGNKNDNGAGDNFNKNDNASANDNEDGGNFNGNVTDGPRNEGPPVQGGLPCGIAMIGPMLFSLLGLLYHKQRLHRRRSG